VRRLFPALATCAVAAAIVVPAASPAATIECPPFPAQLTEACTIVVDDHFVDTETCPFPLQIDAVGRILYTPHAGRDGQLRFESFRPNIRITVTNEANGRQIFDRDVGLDKARFLADGSVEVLSTGLHAKARTSDNDTIFRKIGLQIIHVDAQGNETVEVIGGNIQPDEDFEEIVCGYLGGG
jgi:hypothetical protein